MSTDPKLIGSQNWTPAEWADYWREKCQSCSAELTHARKLHAKLARVEELAKRLEEAGRQTGDPISPYIAEQLRLALRDTL